MMKHKPSKLKKVALILSIVIACIFLFLLCFVSVLYNKHKLDVNQLTSVNNGILVYSVDGNENTLYNTNRSIVDISELPNYVKDAFVSVEDKRFYSHNGYDLKRIAKSLLINLSSQSKTQGASTISQQLIKNALLTNEKTYSRKLKEIVLAIKLEKKFSKDEILEMYLNTIYFGSNAYGIENASKIYFNKSAKELTLNEACCLAGLIKSPGHYSPILNYDNSVERRNLVAKIMLDNNKISKQDYESVINSKIELSQSKEDNGYEKEAILEACNLLNITERELINKKYKIITFKQDDLQQEVVNANNEVIGFAEKNTNTSLDSLSIVSNKHGHILAYYSNSKYNLHNMKRQPASTLKPLAVYLPCFEHNILSPASQILDEEINYSGFSPNNADNKYYGYVSTRFALSHSLNIPAVKALDYVGLNKSKETLSNLGINITNSDLNLSLALGALKNGVGLLDLLTAYNTISNSGEHRSLCFVKTILDENDKVVYNHEDFSTHVVGADSCFLVTDILKDCSKNGTAKRLESLNIPIASKTGTASTSKGNTDLFNIAYTSEHSMLTWIADIDQITLPNNLLSSSQPTEINKLISSYLYANHKPNDFNIPNNIQRHAYDLIELEENHVLTQPNHNFERYIAHDYFKANNAPKIATKQDNINLDVSITKQGATISFNAKKYNQYIIYKNTNKGLVELKTIEEKNNTISFLDKDVFSYDFVEYYITNEGNSIISDVIKLRPKDYLVNYFNNEVFSSKKKWAVNIIPQ